MNRKDPDKPDPPGRRPGNRVGILGARVYTAGLGMTLFLAMGMAPFVQFAIGVLAPIIVDELELTRTQLGLFTSTLFVVAAMTGPRLGSLVDRWSSQPTLLFLFALGIVSAGVLLSAQSLAWILVAAVLAGGSKAISNPATNSVIRLHTTPGKQGLLVGIKQSGIQAAQGISGFALPPLVLLWGWRSAMLLPASVGLLGATLSVCMLKSRTEARRPQSVSDQDPQRLPPALAWLTGYASCLGMAEGVMGTFLALFAYQQLGLGAAIAGFLIGVAGMVGAVSRVTWGPAAERTRHLGRLLGLVALVALLAVLSLWLGVLYGLPAVLVGTILYALSAPVWNVVGTFALFRMTESSATGRASGILYFGFSSGFVVGPLLFGVAVDLTGSYGPGWGMVCATLLLAAGLSQAFTRQVTPLGAGVNN